MDILNSMKVQMLEKALIKNKSVKIINIWEKVKAKITNHNDTYLEISYYPLKKNKKGRLTFSQYYNGWEIDD